MKTVLKISSIVSMILLAGLFACNPDDGGVDSDMRVKYTGDWTATESGGISYPVTITLDASNSTQVLLYNFHYFGQNEKAYAIATASALTFPSQVICGNTINGSATYVSSSKITLQYNVNDQANNTAFSVTYSK
jgi:hypothetical protein